MNKKHYMVTKNLNSGEIIYIDYNKLNGLKIKPQNNIEYDGITVNTMVLIKPSFVEKLLKKKIKRKLDSYLQIIINMLDNDDTDPSDLRKALNEISKYRQLVINKYQQYLDEKYVILLLKKIALLEHELKNKMLNYNPVIESNRKCR